MLLTEPYEYIDLAPGETATYMIGSYADGSVVIHPRTPSPRDVSLHIAQHNLPGPPPAGTPISIEVPALRLYGRRLDQQGGQTYYDVSSKRLRADLLARFIAGLHLPAMIRLTANGQRPRKTYSVEIL